MVAAETVNKRFLAHRQDGGTPSHVSKLRGLSVEWSTGIVAGKRRTEGSSGWAHNWSSSPR